MTRQAGTKKHRDQLRTLMQDQGCTREQIAAEMARRFGFRPRQAWRHTHGWTQDEVAAAYNRLLDHDHAPMTGKRISDFEAWPHAGVKPTINTLAILAIIYGTTPSHLIDLDDRHALSTQDLITLSTTTPPAVPALPDYPHTDTTPVTTTGKHPTPPDPKTSTTTDQPDHTTQEKTAHQPTSTRAPSPRQRSHLILAWLLATTTALGAILITRAPATHTQPTPPPRPSTPSSSTTSGPSSTLLLPPALPSQTALPLHQPLIPSSPLKRAAPVPQPAPAIQPTPPPSARPDSPPSPPPTPHTDSASTTAITWKNMYYNLCLDEQEKDATHDLDAPRLGDCNGSINQKWTEKIIPAHPTSLARNLVSSRSGQCLTYQPESVSVWLAPCGTDGQAWVRSWNGLAYTFQAVQAPGLCMSVTRNPLAEGFIGIQLRPCGPPSPITDWRPC